MLVATKAILWVSRNLWSSAKTRRFPSAKKQPNYTQQLVKQVMFAGLSPVVAVTGEGGIRKAIEHHPDLILLELDLTDMDGLRFVSLLKERESVQKIPIVAHEYRRPNESRGAQGRLQRIHE